MKRKSTPFKYAERQGSDSKEILNGVVNAIVNTGLPSDACTLHVQYIYNSSITFSRGSADFIF